MGDPFWEGLAPRRQRLARLVQCGISANDLAADVDGDEATSVQLDTTNHDAVGRND